MSATAAELIQTVDCDRLVAAGRSLIYWRNPFISGLTFAAGILAFYLVGVKGYSTITLLAYAAMGHIFCRFLYANAKTVLVELKVMEARKPIVIPDEFVTEEQLASLLPALTKAANSALSASLRLLLGECDLFHGSFNPLVFQWLAGLYALALASRLLGTTGLLFVAFLGASLLPKLYELKQKEIDALALRAHASVGQLVELLKEQAGLLLGKAKEATKAATSKVKEGKTEAEVKKDD